MNQKKFKKLVRDRMDTTGERWNVARRFVLAETGLANGDRSGLQMQTSGQPEQAAAVDATTSDQVHCPE